MKIYITDKSEVREITLRTWDARNYSPDCFADLADDLPRDYPISEDDRWEYDAVCAMTDQDYRETVEWWNNEINGYNARRESNWFVEDLSADERDAEYARGLEYALDAD